MWAEQVYGPLPVATPQLAAPVNGEPQMRQAQPKARRPSITEAAAPMGDPVLVWVILVGLAIALGWVSIRLDVGR